MRSVKTGTYSIQVIQHYSSSYKYVLYEYTISAANTWEQKTITISPNTSDAIQDDTSIGFYVTWWLCAHSDVTTSATSSWASGGSYRASTNQVNLWDSGSNDWYLTGCQLEVGDTATAFEHRSFGEELTLCQRYFQSYPHDDNSTANGIRLNGDYSSVFQTPMRTTPTGVVYGVSGPAGGNSGKYDKDAVGNQNAAIETKHSGFEIDTDGGVGLAAVTLDAEL